MQTIEHSIDINAPIGRVWDLTVDVESWPQITPTTMTSVERLDDGPIRPGSTARVKQPRQRPHVWTVATVDPERRFAWHAKVFGMRLVATHTLAEADGSTRNTLRIDVEGPLAGVVGRLLARPIHSTIATENERFKAVAET